MEKWDERIRDIEEFFEKTDIPDGPIQVTKYAVIVDVGKFVSNHMSIVKANNGKRTFIPYLQRLMWIKKLIQNDHGRTNEIRNAGVDRKTSTGANGDFTGKVT